MDEMLFIVLLTVLVHFNFQFDDFVTFFFGPNFVMKKYLLVMIKIHNHILFKTTALKSKGKFVSLSKSNRKHSYASCVKKCLLWMERQNNVDAIQIMQL